MSQKMFLGVAFAVVIAVMALGGVVATLYRNDAPQNQAASAVSDFQTCKMAGYPIMESHPEQCKTPDGRTFVNTYVESSTFNTQTTFVVGQSTTFDDGMRVTLKAINDSRCKEGVQCVWQGELSPVLILEGGMVTDIAEVILGTATKTSVVSGSYTLELKNATEQTATIVVKKQGAQPVAACYVGGCSSQVCSDQKDVITTCEYKEEYGCYQTAVCARQADGQCGWTMTPQLQQCLSGYQ